MLFRLLWFAQERVVHKSSTLPSTHECERKDEPRPRTGEEKDSISRDANFLESEL